jgi:predicted ester cyclase
MSEQNKTLTRRFYEEVINKKNLNAIDELCSPGVVDHNPLPGQAPGAQGLKEVFKQFLQAFPDMTATVQEMVAERDLVVTRLTCQGTHKGSFMNAAPTGRKATFTALDMVRVKDGKATEVWHQGDDLVVLMELGVKMPAAATAQRH